MCNAASAIIKYYIKARRSGMCLYRCLHTVSGTIYQCKLGPRYIVNLCISIKSSIVHLQRENIVFVLCSVLN